MERASHGFWHWNIQEFYEKSKGSEPTFVYKNAPFRIVAFHYYGANWKQTFFPSSPHFLASADPIGFQILTFFIFQMLAFQKQKFVLIFLKMNFFNGKILSICSLDIRCKVSTCIGKHVWPCQKSLHIGHAVRISTYKRTKYKRPIKQRDHMKKSEKHYQTPPAFGRYDSAI